MRHVRWGLGLAVIVMFPSAAGAQLAPIGVPRGLIRLDLGGGFTSADSRYFRGIEQDLGADWSGTLNTTALPALAGAEQEIRQLTGNGRYRLSLGQASVATTYQVGRINLGMSYGITRALTIFGNIPIVRVRTQAAMRQDSASANAGYNPADPIFGVSGGAAQATAFFSAFGTALTTLSTKIANGDYNGDPAQLALANQTLTAGTALRDGLQSLNTSPVLPVAASAEGTQILGLIGSLQNTLSSSLGVAGFTGAIALPSTRFDASDYLNLLTNPSGPVGGILVDGLVRNRMGDAELGTTLTLLDRWHEDGRPGIRVAASALVRLPTGLVPQPGVFFDRGTGDGQTDVEFRLTADLTRGAFGARISADYNDQLPGTVTREVLAPSMPLAWFAPVAPMRWDPGNEL
ncbi:MAG: hypothetical protein ACHQXA_10845, partial [Gemmatimonadales bacterium]